MIEHERGVTTGMEVEVSSTFVSLPLTCNKSLLHLSLHSLDRPSLVQASLDKDVESCSFNTEANTTRWPKLSSAIDSVG